MSRSFVPSVLMVALACGGLAWGEGANKAPASSSTYPSLENRVGKTITIAMPNRQPEKAVILQVWRLANGQAAMQAHSLVSGEPLTIVEDEKAKTLAERFVVYRWKPDGTPPPGCPLPPATAKVAGTSTITQTETKVTTAASTTTTPQAPVTQVSAQTTTQQRSTTTKEQVVKTQPKYSAGLMPPKEETKVTTTASVAPTQTVTVTQPTPHQVVTTATTTPIMEVQPNQVVTVPAPKAPVVTTTTATAMSPYAKPSDVNAAPPVMSTMSSSPYATTNSSKTTSTTPKVMETVSTTTVATAPMQETTVSTKPVIAKETTTIKPVANQSTTTSASAPATMPTTPVNTYGKQTITVTENGKDRTCVVLSETKVKGGGCMMKVQACDNGECFVVSCCSPSCTACDKAKPCPQVITRCEPAKVECKPAPCPCPPAPKVECKVECKTEKKVVKCDPCDRPLACKPFKVKCKEIDRSCMISVPVPNVPLWTPGCTPMVPPPCADIAPYNTMESPAMKDYMAKWDAYLARQACKNSCCGPMTQAAAMGQMGVLTDAYDAQVAKNTLYLMTVLQTSPHPQNRAWAADRLRVVNDPKYQAYVADALIISAQTDPIPEVRMTAMASLGVMRVNNAKMQEMLAKATRDQNDMVRTQAAQVQAKIIVDGMIQQTGFSTAKHPFMDR